MDSSDVLFTYLVLFVMQLNMLYFQIVTSIKSQDGFPIIIEWVLAAPLV